MSSPLSEESSHRSVSATLNDFYSAGNVLLEVALKTSLGGCLSRFP